jgi:hypothetical protein
MKLIYPKQFKFKDTIITFDCIVLMNNNVNNMWIEIANKNFYIQHSFNAPKNYFTEDKTEVNDIIYKMKRRIYDNKTGLSPWI